MLFTKFEVPTCVITLAGLLAFLGLQLKVLGPNGSINRPYESWIVQFATSMFLFVVLLVVFMNFMLTRTRWGRDVFAVGGLMASARLTSASLSSGGGDTNLVAISAAVIGGTSLFGGRGSAYSALLGIIVIQSISSGLRLLNLDSSIRYMITDAVLLLAVIIDALSRRSRANHGQA